MKIGDPLDDTTTVGATISEEHAGKVLGYIEGAIKEGATVACGGKRVLLQGKLKSLTLIHGHSRRVRDIPPLLLSCFSLNSVLLFRCSDPKPIWSCDYILNLKFKISTIVTGDCSGGYYLSPCILTDCHDEMTAVKEEIFGSVAAVLPFDTEDEVVKRANNSPYGLAGNSS